VRRGCSQLAATTSTPWRRSRGGELREAKTSTGLATYRRRRLGARRLRWKRWGRRWGRGWRRWTRHEQVVHLSQPAPLPRSLHSATPATQRRSGWVGNSRVRLVVGRRWWRQRVRARTTARVIFTWSSALVPPSRHRSISATLAGTAFALACRALALDRSIATVVEPPERGVCLAASDRDLIMALPERNFVHEVRPRIAIAATKHRAGTQARPFGACKVPEACTRPCATTGARRSGYTDVSRSTQRACIVSHRHARLAPLFPARREQQSVATPQAGVDELTLQTLQEPILLTPFSRTG
jgi:hypothetical protein